MTVDDLMLTENYVNMISVLSEAAQELYGHILHKYSEIQRYKNSAFKMNDCCNRKAFPEWSGEYLKELYQELIDKGFINLWWQRRESENGDVYFVHWSKLVNLNKLIFGV